MNYQALLTIDDGPTVQTLELCDFLESENIAPVFFFIGQRIESYFDIAVEVVRRGYIVANHSYSHPTFSKVSLKQAKSEIEKTEVILKQVYNQANCSMPIKLFRFPFGDRGAGPHLDKLDKRRIKKRDNLKQYLRDSGYQHPCLKIKTERYKEYNLLKDPDVLWSYNTRDYTVCSKNNKKYDDRTLDDLLDILINDDVAFGTNHIVLAHDFEGYLDNFKAIIQHLKKKGFDFFSDYAWV